jgi:ribonuclease G
VSSDKNAGGVSDRKIVADTRESEETRVAVLENGRLAEIFRERMWDHQKAGEIYKARVDSVVPGINAAFVSIGDGRNAFLYLNDARGMEIVPNQEIVVQVTKTARKNKGARVTPRLSLPGRYLVLVPNGDEAGVSRRIADESERKRLRHLARELRGGDYGVIVRTAAEGVDGEALARDVQSLLALWRDIEHNASRQPSPCLLYKDIGLLGRVLRDEAGGDIDEILVDGEDELGHVRDFVSMLYGDNRPDVTLYRGAAPIFEHYGIEREIEQALERKVWLRSGAYLVIEHTEALTVIDVNTGKYVGDPGATDMRHTVIETNLEAAEEIARQLRLRAIGGIVVVDFIDMEFEEDRRRLLTRLEDVFQPDRARAGFQHDAAGAGRADAQARASRPEIRPDARLSLLRGQRLGAEGGHDRPVDQAFSPQGGALQQGRGDPAPGQRGRGAVRERHLPALVGGRVRAQNPDRGHVRFRVEQIPHRGPGDARHGRAPREADGTADGTTGERGRCP